MIERRAIVRLAALATVASAQRAYANEKGPMLGNGQFLSTGDFLVADNRQYFAIMQGDGNLCVYRGSGPGNNQGFVWGSVQVGGYAPRPGYYLAIMQGDGNLCVYRGGVSPQGFVWGSVQDGGYPPVAGNYLAVMQGDGNLCVYRIAVDFVWGSIQSSGRLRR